MFSYRHGFHAGNHADVLKHTILSRVLDYYRGKDAPFWAIDTHAGAGLYDLSGGWANTKSEYADGVGRIWEKLMIPDSGTNSRSDSAQHVPDALGPWLETVRQLNPDGQLRYYPGSPWIWLHGWRKQDKLKLVEQLTVEAEVLRRNLAQVRDLPPRSVQVLEQDGFESLKGFLPPSPRRAIVLVDPSYEDKRDYHRVIEMLKDAVVRFSTGCYMVWYPRVSRLQVDQMRKQLRRLSPGQWLDIEMTVSRPASDGHGLFGSGCFVVNPPYTLEGEMREAMPWLSQTLALDDTARWSIESGDETLTNASRSDDSPDSKPERPVKRNPGHPPRIMRAEPSYKRTSVRSNPSKSGSASNSTSVDMSVARPRGESETATGHFSDKAPARVVRSNRSARASKQRTRTDTRPPKK
ncbi:hypothetical protein DBV39_05740 [Orrella marina]|uniref:Ribosomal RNA large subunit methyltransferase J n=1 Tax=Orrella marina TaxID=2163011 RepID=A0A2R4XHJ6_9BURK|nr:hypothetical protein DBV39_05740 [Orrella marina]